MTLPLIALVNFGLGIANGVFIAFGDDTTLNWVGATACLFTGGFCTCLWLEERKW